MRFEHVNLLDDKGWYTDPWDSNLPISVGFANKGIDQPHVHSHIMEIYLVARGTADIRVEQQTITLSAGDMIVVDPGEAHTFLSSSHDYFHFVIHTPGLTGEKARTEKSSVPRSRLGM
jgi:mannose-6-phosphate isomerase-like protein (cupin superfamily)